MEKQTGFKSGKENMKAVYWYSAYLTYMQSTSFEMPGWIKQVGIKVARRNINNLRWADTTLIAEREELKTLLMKLKEHGENAGLKLKVQKSKIMEYGPITSWQIDGETMETVRYFIFFSSKITANGDCSHEFKRLLLLGRRAMINLDILLISRGITLPTKIQKPQLSVKAMACPVVMYRCEIWTIKKAKH